LAVEEQNFVARRQKACLWGRLALSLFIPDICICVAWRN
jgi:hypothetical protein